MTQNSPSGFVRTEDQAQIDVEALRLRSTGMTYRQIGALQGVEGTTARLRCLRALNEISQDTADEYRRLELEKLDAQEQKANEVLAKDHVYVSQSGKVIYDGTEKLLDSGPILQAINTLLKIGERRSRLLGLDAPVKQSVEVVTYDGNSIEARVAELRSALGQLGGESLPVDGRISEAGTTT